MPRVSHTTLVQRRLAGQSSIAQVAARLGLSLRTLRFYEEEGMVTPVRQGACRWYSAADISKLETILLAKQLGYRLQQIKRLTEGNQGHEFLAAELMRSKDARDRIRRLEEKRDRISDILNLLGGSTPPSAPGVGR